ncbi:MAG: hypothetical protein ACYC55_02245 [Candidatus Geothermincolia bacterium]
MDCIQVAPGAEVAPLTGVLADLLRGNLEEKPFRMKDFNALDISVGIDATDAESQITLEFQKGSLLVHNGLRACDMVIKAEVQTLLDITGLAIKFGLPWYFDKTGLDVLKKLLTGDLKIKGMLAHPLALTRLTKVMSVAD